MVETNSTKIIKVFKNYKTYRQTTYITKLVLKAIKRCNSQIF